MAAAVGASCSGSEEEEAAGLLAQFKSPLSDSPCPAAGPDSGGGSGVRFIGWATWACDPYEDSLSALDAKADAAARAAHPGARAATADEYTSGVIRGLPPTNDSGKLMVLRSPGNLGSVAVGAVSGHKLQCLATAAALDGSFTHGASGKGPRSVLCVIGPVPLCLESKESHDKPHEPEPERGEVRLDISAQNLEPESEPEPETELEDDPFADMEFLLDGGGSDSEAEDPALDSSDDGGGADDTDDPWPPLEAMLAGGDNEPEPEPEQQQNVGLPCRQSSLLGRLSSALSVTSSRPGDASALVNTSTLAVGEYAGQEVAIMYHGTDSRAAQLIVAGQRFKPSTEGLLGNGVYVTRTRQKAEGYRIHHPNGASPTNAPLPSGAPDPGCILQFRARLGCCRTFTRQDALPMQRAHEAWHGQEVRAEDITPQIQAAASAAGIQVLRYNSAFSAGCACCPRHGEGCPGNPDKDERIILPPGKEPCDGRCHTYMPYPSFLLPTTPPSPPSPPQQL
eukprot:COSAG05_NODE_268_length_12518_cov_6.452774_8_plen_509_part_00